jgi:RNA-directed DNA polymerase
MSEWRRQSDRLVVPAKLANKANGSSSGVAESVEERSLAKGNLQQQNTYRTQRRERVNNALERVREAARKDRKTKFTTLMHHICNVETLEEAFFGLRRRAAAGVDGVTWQDYGVDLAANLRDLSHRLCRGAYRPKPVRRVLIDKASGGQRALGVTTVEDKIVQSATSQVLNAIYETDFVGFSYGFRPGRNQHQALDAVWVGIKRKRVGWVLDADIRGFFDAIDHQWMTKFVEHRVGDKRVVRLIQKWLKAGVMKDEVVSDSELGTPQGGSISPLLANIYLHYVLDLWVAHWRRRKSGDVIVVRYADDIVFGIQTHSQAKRLRADLERRLNGFGLELHPQKTRLIEFGRFAAQDRRSRGEGKPETFEFLGFTHYCGQTKQGWFIVKRRSIRRRVRAKLKELKELLMRRRHQPVPQVAVWLRSVLRGHYNYYGVPHNGSAIGYFYMEVCRLWRRALSRRSQKGTVTWERMHRLRKTWLPLPRICHPHPNQRLVV